MKIEKIIIDAFGKLSDKEYSLSPGINCFLGKNESGKSTVKNFILEMFFAGTVPDTKRALYDREFLRYKPWNDNRFSGKLIIREGKDEFLISRNFLKNFEKLEVINLRNGADSKKYFGIDESRKVQVFDENYFGIDEKTLRELFLIIEKTELSNRDSKKMVEKIKNFIATKSQDVSVNASIEKINNLYNENILKKTKKQLEREKDALVLKTENSISDYQYDELILELEEIDKKIFSKENEEDNLKDHKKLNELISSKIILEDKIDSLEKKEKNSKNYKLMRNILIISAIFSIFVGFFSKNAYFYALVSIFTVFSIALNIYIKRISKIKDDLRFLYGKLDVLNEEIEDLEFGKRDDDFFEMKLERERLLEKIRYFDRKIEENKNINCEIKSIENKLEDIELKKAMSEESISIINRIIDENLRDINSQLLEIAGKYIEIITDGKYNKFYFKDDGSIMLFDFENNDAVHIEDLSNATIEQIYLAFKLALISVSKIDFPIIIDDGFSFYDDSRLDSSLNLLNELSKNFQIIIFSSNENLKNLSARSGYEVNFIGI